MFRGRIGYCHRSGKAFRAHSLREGDRAATLSGPAFKVLRPVDLAEGRARAEVWTDEGRNSKRTWIHGSAEVYALNPDTAEKWSRRKGSAKPFRNWREVRVLTVRGGGPEGVGWVVTRHIPRDEYEGRDLAPNYEVRQVGIPRKPDGTSEVGWFGGHWFDSAPEALACIADWYARRRLDETPDLMTPVTLADGMFE